MKHSKTLSLPLAGIVVLGLCGIARSQESFRLDDISPSEHPTEGGSLATITGEGFSDVTSIEIGGQIVSSTTVVSANEVLVVLPSLPVGVYDVFLRHPERLPAVLTDAVRVKAARFAGVEELHCERFLNGVGQEIQLSWRLPTWDRSPVEFDGIEIYRDDEVVATLPGSETHFADEDFEAEESRIRYGVAGFFERNGSRVYSHAMTCVAVESQPEKTLVRFASYRPSGQRMLLRVPRGKAARGNEIEAVFEVDRAIEGARISVHARRFDEDAQLRARVRRVDTGEVICDNIEFQEAEVSLTSRWIRASCREPLASGEYILGIYATGIVNRGNTAYSVSVDASSYRHDTVCGPYPLVRVEAPPSPADELELRELVQCNVRAIPGASSDREDGRIEVALFARSETPESFDYFLWKFSDGSQAQTSGPEIIALLPSQQIVSVKVRGYNASGIAASHQALIATGVPDLPQPSEDGGGAGNDIGLPPRDIEAVCLLGELPDLDLLTGKTRGVEIPFLVWATALNGRQIRSITLDIIANNGAIQKTVEADLIANWQLDGDYRGGAFMNVSLPRIESRFMQFRFTVEDTGGNVAEPFTERIELCQLPPPFDEDWVRTAIEGDAQSGFTVEGIFPRGGPVWRDDFTIPIVDVDLTNRFNMNYSAKVRFSGGYWTPLSLDGEVEATLLDVPVIDSIDFHVDPVFTTPVPCEAFNMRFRKNNIELYDGRQMCVPVVPAMAWVVPIGPVPVATIEFGLDACVEFDVRADIDLRLNDGDPDFSTTVRPSVTGSLPATVTAKVLAGLANLKVVLTPTVGVELPIEISYAPFRNDIDIDVGWCLDMSVYGTAEGCLGWWRWPCHSFGGYIIDPIYFPRNCAGRGAGAAVSAPAQSISPTISASPSGNTGIMVLLDEGTPERPPRLLFRTRVGDSPFGTERAMFPPSFNALVQDPSVAVLDDDTAIAVWTQNRTPIDEIPAVGEETLDDWNLALSSRDIAFSVWDGTSWGQPRFIISDNLADGVPVVRRVDAQRAVASWVTSGGTQAIREDGSIDFAKLEVRTAFLGENGVVAGVTLLTGDQEGLKASDTEPSIAFSPNGQRGLAVWVRDLDGNMSTPEDRFFAYSEFEGGAWSVARALTDPGELPGVVQPTVTLVRERFGVVAGVLPSGSETVPLFHKDSRVFAIPLRAGNFGQPRFLRGPNVTGSGFDCDFEQGVTGFEPSLAMLDASTVALGFRTSGATMNVSDAALTVAALTTFDLAVPGAQAEWSPMQAVASPPGGLASFSMTTGAGASLDLLIESASESKVSVVNAPAAADLAVTDVLFENPIAALGANISCVAVVENLGLGASRSRTLDAGTIDSNGEFVSHRTETISELEPGEQELIEFSLYVPRDATAFEIRAQPSGLEPATDNNRRRVRLGLRGPDELVCGPASADRPKSVALDWVNRDPYEEVFVYRDARVVAVLAGTATSYVDVHATVGPHVWAVRGRLGSVRSEFSKRCSWDVPSADVGGGRFLRGDANGDGGRDISDAVATLAFLFLGGEAPSCMKTADCNDDGRINISDPSFLLAHLFLGGRPLPDPSVCGVDPTADAIDCVSYAPCQ